MDNLYPLALHKRGSSFVWEGFELDSLIVHDEAEHIKALDGGWVEIAEILRGMDADGDGKMGGSIDRFDQMSDEELRALVSEAGVTLHHRAGRGKMLQILREEENGN